MEDIVRHYTGLATFDKPSIVKFAHSLRKSGTVAGMQRPRSMEGDEEFRIDPVSDITTGKLAN